MKVMVVDNNSPSYKAVVTASEAAVRLLDGLDQEGWDHKAQLEQRFYANPSGQPLKTQMAERFPLLSRRERRELLRAAEKTKA